VRPAGASETRPAPAAAAPRGIPAPAPLTATAPETAAPSALDVTVVVPIQSPEAEVREVLEALGAELDREAKSWEVVFVFDGVAGRAWNVVEELRAEHAGRVKTIAFKNHFGDSVCLAAALEIALGRIVVTSPQYVQIDPVEIRPMLQAMESGADFVTPWRSPRVDPWLNRLQSSSFNWVIRRIIGMQFHDLNCHFRAIRREVLADVAIYGDQYRFLPVTAHRQGYRVVEVRVRHIKEWGQAGFFGVGVYLRRFLDILAVMFLTNFTLKPLRFFGTVGGLFFLCGAGISAYLAVQKLLHGTGVSGSPLLLLGVVLMVLGVQVIGIGLLGEIVIYTQARNLKEYRVERIWE
jgi:glycosyltransferase involved in cell wall biosynthesis